MEKFAWRKLILGASFLAIVRGDFRPVLNLQETVQAINATSILRNRAETDAEFIGYPPSPTYGVPTDIPPPEIPPTGEARITIDVHDHHNVALRCSAHEPYEHMVWRRFPCPNQYMYGYGETVAEGASIVDPEHFGVVLSGRLGVISSSLTLKDPVHHGGLFLCEAWPHASARQGIQEHPLREGKPSSDVFTIGGRELIEDCFHPLGPRPRRPRNATRPSLMPVVLSGPFFPSPRDPRYRIAVSKDGLKLCRSTFPLEPKPLTKETPK